jgi:toxin-antitoxin system PIN domain toxin
MLFPDVNVWVALVWERHLHNESAVAWYGRLDPLPRFIFCRHTQLGLLRLLSTQAAMQQDTMSLSACWALYDQWARRAQAVLLPEPVGLERELRANSELPIVEPKLLADAYLAAFAQVANLTLVTFDRALASKTPNSILLT